MNSKRAYAIQSRLVLRLKDVFSSTKCFHRNLDAHIAECKRVIYETPEYKRLSQHRKSYIAGCASILWDNLYEGRHAPLVYIKIGPDGKRFGPKDDTWLNESSEYKSALTGAHVWFDAWEKGEFKPW